MADFGSPVAQNVDPAQGITTLSKLMALRNQNQQFQIGQQSLQQQQIETQRQQTTIQEQQALAKLNGNIKSYFDKDGVFDADRYNADAQAVTPFTGLGAQRAEKMYQIRSAQLGVQSAAQNLNEQQRLDFSNRLETAIQKNDGQPVDLLKLGEDYKKENPAASKLVDSVLSNMKPQDNWEQTRQKVHVLNLALKGVGTPAVGTQFDKSGNLTGTTQSGLTGAVATAGGSIPVGVSPTQQPGYVRQIAGIGGEQQADTQRFAGIMGAAANSQSGVALADEVSALAKQVRTGALSKEWADRLTVLKQNDPSITARQMLGKYAAQLQTLAENSASSDAERSQIKSGMPNPDTMDPDALRQAAQYLHGYFRMSQERGANAVNHIKTTGGIPGITVNDTNFASQRDPFVYAFKDMSREDQKEFLIHRFGHGKSAALDDFERRVKQQ